MLLTKKQTFYLSLIQKAQTENQSLRQVAQDNDVVPSRLYASVKSLRKKGALPVHDARTASSFIKVPMETARPTQRIELKTQLSNGQPLWLGINEAQLRSVLQVLGE